jgi:hypothetical protein
VKDLRGFAAPLRRRIVFRHHSTQILPKSVVSEARSKAGS